MLYLEKPKSKLNVVYYTYIKAKDKHVEKVQGVFVIIFLYHDIF